MIPAIAAMCESGWMSESGWMRKGVEVRLGPGERVRLEVSSCRGTSRRSTYGGRGSCCSAPMGDDGDPAADRQGKPTIWRWQARLWLKQSMSAARGYPPGRQAAADGRDDRAGGRDDARRTAGETTHWTGRAMAQAVGVSHRSVQRIWAAHGLKPHRVRRRDDDARL